MLETELNSDEEGDEHDELNDLLPVEIVDLTPFHVSMGKKWCFGNLVYCGKESGTSNSVEGSATTFLDMSIIKSSLTTILPQFL